MKIQHKIEHTSNTNLVLHFFFQWFRKRRHIWCCYQVSPDLFISLREREREREKREREREREETSRQCVWALWWRATGRREITMSLFWISFLNCWSLLRWWKKIMSLVDLSLDSGWCLQFLDDNNIDGGREKIPYHHFRHPTGKGEIEDGSLSSF